MDGFQDFLRTVKRLHFWIICPTIVLLGLGAWWLAVSKLDKQEEANHKRIEQHYQTLAKIRGIDPHPNENVQQGMEQLISKRREEVENAWREKWKQQTAENGILTWPAELKPEFIQKVERYRPIEKMVGFPGEGEQLRIDLRRHYRDYIKDELPKLAAMIRSEWKADESRMSPEGDNPYGRRQRRSSQFIVDWNVANQQEIQQNHFDWSGRSQRLATRDGAPQAEAEGVPSLLEILYAQEDLWVLRAIMQVIDRTNGKTHSQATAAVKEIEFIRLGRDAARNAGRITRVQGAAAEREGTGDVFGPGLAEHAQHAGDLGDQMAGGHTGGGHADGPFDAAQGAPTGPDPAEGRYVDKDYVPLPAAKLREVMSSQQVAPEDAYLAVAKRIPVRMRLRMDQRGLNRLLVECASSELTIEVRQLRINPPMEDRGGSYSFQPSRGMGDVAGGQLVDEDERSGFDVTVELYGIIYIFNPVDRKVLGYEDDGSNQATNQAVAAT
jgi:hypothetical protein